MVSAKQTTRQPPIGLRSLKQFVERSVPPDSTLYKIMMSEKDELSPEEYVGKSEVWLRLIDITFQSGGLASIPPTNS